MRLTPALLGLSFVLQGCYLFHGVGEEAPGRADAMPLAPDAGALPRPREFRDGSTPLPPGLVPDDVEVPIERPREELTCDGGDEALTELCGALPIVHLASDGRDGGAGSAASPFGEYEDALAACAAGCQLRIERGEIGVTADGFPIGACMWISGGWIRTGEAWASSDERTVLRGGGDDGMFSTMSRLLVERVSIVGVHSAISAGEPSDLLVVRDVEIDAGYSGISTAGTTGARICRTRIVSGYEGISISHGTSDVVIEAVDIDAEYTGISVSWGSSSVVIRGSNIRGGYEGVGVSWESHDVAIEDSTLDGGHSGLDVNWESSHVLVSGSIVGGCYEPVTVNQGAHTVKVTGTELRPCVGGAYEE